MRKQIVLALITSAMLLSACAENGTPPTPANIASTPVPAAPAVPASDATVAFEPFVGIPGNRADQLAAKIGDEARRENLKLVRRVDETATYRVRGYLTAVGGESTTTIVYVYDIFSGNTRVYRISGQETSEGSRGDPWTGVDNDALNNIAKRTVISIKAWLNRGS